MIYPQDNNEIEKPDKENETKVNNDIVIEGKILNQLIHQIKPENIPQSHFKIKKEFPKQKAVGVTITIIIFTALLLFVFNRGVWSSFVNNITTKWLKCMLLFTTTDVFKVLAVVTCMVIFFFALYFLWKLQHNKNILKKISIQGNEIEIFGKTEDSFFNKHLNEVLYLFRNTQASAIVFEDMDRYNSNYIFEKLREINYLLNNGVYSDNKKVYRFFYLLRDDIFTTKDRTKFFDFIIPIVPVIDGANSYDQFIKHFEEGGILTNFDPNFLQEISLYVDDMRILKNIYNEYIIYHNSIQSTELNCNKLLAMIIYKNLFPRDFSELQIGKGFGWCLFNSTKIQILIKANIIAMNIYNLSFIRENYLNVKMHFIKANIKLYVDEIINVETFDFDELLKLLPDKIQDKYILKLLGFTNEPISIRSINLSKNIKKHILENNYSKNDLSYFIFQYNNEISEIREILFKHFLEQIDDIISLKIKLPYNLFIKMLQSLDIDSLKKYLLLISQLESFSKEQAKECLNILKMTTLLTVFEGKRPLINLPNDLTSSNIQFLEIMKKKNWISSYEADKNKLGFYRVIGKKSILNIL